LLASDEDLEINECDDVYNCELCPVADALADLHADAANAEAWELFKRTMSRFTVDTQTERFAIIYDALHPPPEQKEANGS
jgi:hypothetical protein